VRGDGVSLDVPLDLLASLDAALLAWGVPGKRHELLTTLTRGVPTALRRPLVRAPATAAAILALADTAQPLWPETARLLSRHAGHPIPEEALRAVTLPDHLRFNLRVLADDGRMLAEGRDLAALRLQLRDTGRQALEQSTRDFARRDLRDWDLGRLAASITIERGDVQHLVYPALADRNGTVTLEAFEDPVEAEAMHRSGLRRLLARRLADPLKPVRKSLVVDRELALLQQPRGPLSQLIDDVCDRAVDRACLPRSESLPRDREAFDMAYERGRGQLYAVAIRLAACAKAVLQAARAIQSALDRLPSEFEPAAAADCRRGLARLAGPRFVATTPDAWIDELPRLLAGLQARVDQLGEGRNPSAQRELVAWQARIAALADRGLASELEWLLAEYCVSLFAQRLGTSVPVSARRLEQRLGAASG
jgi:ATP-dependent helicase HrpA